MSMRPPALDLPIMFIDVRVTAGAVTILDGVTLTISPGLPTVLIGPNGAGKTTLLRAAMGLVPAKQRPHHLGRPRIVGSQAPRHHVSAAGDAQTQRRRQCPLRAGRRRHAARQAS